LLDTRGSGPSKAIRAQVGCENIERKFRTTFHVEHSLCRTRWVRPRALRYRAARRERPGGGTKSSPDHRHAPPGGRDTAGAARKACSSRWKLPDRVSADNQRLSHVLSTATSVVETQKFFPPTPRTLEARRVRPQRAAAGVARQGPSPLCAAQDRAARDERPGGRSKSSPGPPRRPHLEGWGRGVVTIDNRAAPHGCDPGRTITNRAADLRRPGARAAASGDALTSRRNRATAMRGPGKALNPTVPPRERRPG
jgi:hypothetical protein